jgi:hypothetical protein
MVLKEFGVGARGARVPTTWAYSLTRLKVRFVHNNMAQARPKLKGCLEKGHLPRGFKLERKLL